MTIDQAAVFLACSILMMMGLIVIIAGAVAINYIINKYWKPVKVFTPDSWSAFNPPDLKIEPKVDNK